MKLTSLQKKVIQYFRGVGKECVNASSMHAIERDIFGYNGGKTRNILSEMVVWVDGKACLKPEYKKYLFA